MKNKVLVHACCGVCFSYPLILLREMGLEPVVYYFNPNIYPYEEFERRYLELEKYCRVNKVELIKEEYNHKAFLDMTHGLEDAPEKGERCKKCFYLRLDNACKKALELEIDKITTTLTVSPHKISKDIFEAGRLACKDSGIEFLEFDFKKHDGFKKTSKIAYDFGMYRQNYCGCEFSIRKNDASKMLDNIK